MADNKRFLLFAGSIYYPAGGMDDLISTFDNLEEAMKALRDSEKDWQHVYDTQTGETLYA